MWHHFSGGTGGDERAGATWWSYITVPTAYKLRVYKSCSIEMETTGSDVKNFRYLVAP